MCGDKVGQVATLQLDTSPPKNRDFIMAEWWEQNPSLTSIRYYLQEELLPSDEKTARQIVLEHPGFCFMDNVLYQVMKDGTGVCGFMHS